MKTIICLIISCFISSASFADTPKETSPSLQKELSAQLHFDLSKFDLQDNRAFVKASFRVLEDGSIEVLETNYSNPELKKEVMVQLQQVTLKNNIIPNQTYYCNFTFKID